MALLSERHRVKEANDHVDRTYAAQSGAERDVVDMFVEDLVHCSLWVAQRCSQKTHCSDGYLNLGWKSRNAEIIAVIPSWWCHTARDTLSRHRDYIAADLADHFHAPKLS